MAVLYGTMQNGQLVAVEADAQGRLVAQLASGDPPKYQEGAWIPTSTAGAVGFDPDRCRWSRIGNTVTVWANITSFTDRTSAVSVSITGLPYLGNEQYAVGSCMFNLVNNTPYTLFLSAPGDRLQAFRGGANSGTNWRALQHTDLAAGANGYLTATFLTADSTWAPQNGATAS